MTSAPAPATLAHATRESLLHALYEAAELEHNLMCTYLYAAFSLKAGVEEDVSASEAESIARWRQTILAIAIDEMSHLVAVWNITSALGGVPRFGRTNFPIDPGYLPARVVVKLAPFNQEVLQHFVYLERPTGSTERDGEGFAPEHWYHRGASGSRLTPMPLDYATVGEFYVEIGAGLRALVERIGAAAAFDGNPDLQLSDRETSLPGAKRVICLKSALAAFESIVLQGEGAPDHTAGSHFERFTAIRTEYETLKQANPGFLPSHPAATNPVLRSPPRPEGRVWIEDERAIAIVDLANAAYGLMLRLLAYAYSTAAPDPDKSLAVELSVGLMRAVGPLGEYAARLPAGPSNPNCNAGMSFTSLRDAAPLPPGISARRFFVERFAELANAAGALDSSASQRLDRGVRLIDDLARRATRGFELSASAAPVSAPTLTADAVAATASAAAPTMQTTSDPSTFVDGTEVVEGSALTLLYEARRCIHARFCVTGAPTVFLANVKGPWLHPDTLDVERLAAIAQDCPSGAIRYRRKDGRPDETAPPVNLAVIREAGPYAFRAQLRIGGVAAGFRATLCRCGASGNKPYCDGSHHAAGFSATGEPASGQTDMLEVRDGTLEIEPQLDGPLSVQGNLEITAGTGRVVARLTRAVLCRCGGSANKPFCDGTHARIGFRS
jgi:CDGSH-type Zn-finger protein/uncharacterized Fe-S cluster protein YjdI